MVGATGPYKLKMADGLHLDI